jgi:hypothetical protein
LYTKKSFLCSTDFDVAMVASSLEEAVRLQLAAAVEADACNTAEDILRCYKEQATLLFETERIKSALTTDPFEHLHDAKSSVARLAKLLRVTEYHCVTTLAGYARTEATVVFAVDKAMKPTVTSQVQLKFMYERTANAAAQVTYSIDLSKDFGPSERMLWVSVEAVGSSPSINQAKNLAECSDDGDDQWSDMDEDDDDDEDNNNLVGDDDHGDDDHGDDTAEGTDDNPLRAEKMNGHQTEEEDSACDTFIAGIDPELLTNFTQWTKLGPMDDMTAFFLLMTFQFYELEWDLVGFLLDAVFGSEDEDDDEGDDETLDAKRA